MKKMTPEELEIYKSEPDYLEFTYREFECFVKRNNLKAWCGYVMISLEKYPQYKDKHYDDLDIDVHGGLTFSQDGYKKHGKNVLVIGFDCAHSEDTLPRYSIDEEFIKIQEIMFVDSAFKELSELYGEKTTYKDMKFVKKECEGIVDQIVDIKDE